MALFTKDMSTLEMDNIIIARAGKRLGPYEIEDIIADLSLEDRRLNLEKQIEEAESEGWEYKRSIYEKAAKCYIDPHLSEEELTVPGIHIPMSVVDSWLEVGECRLSRQHYKRMEDVQDMLRHLLDLTKEIEEEVESYGGLVDAVANWKEELEALDGDVSEEGKGKVYDKR